MSGNLSDPKLLAVELEAVRTRLADAMATNKYPDIDITLKTIADQLKSGEFEGGLIDDLEMAVAKLDEHDHPRAIGIVRGAIDLLSATLV